MKWKENPKKKNELDEKKRSQENSFTISIDFAIHSSLSLLIEPNRQLERIAVIFNIINDKKDYAKKDEKKFKKAQIKP